MLKLLLDENLRIDALWYAIATQRESNGLQDSTDISRVGGSDAPALGTQDDALLEWSATAGRIIVSLDKTTLPNYLIDFLKKGGSSPGLIILRRGLTIPQMAELLITISYAGDAAEFADQCNWVP
jgi:hypothetical protein